MSSQGKTMKFLLIAAVVVAAFTIAIALLISDASDRTDKFWTCLGFLVFAELFLFLGGLVGRNTLPIRLVYLAGVIIVTVASPHMALKWVIVTHIILAALAVISLLGFGFASRHVAAHTGADKTSRVFIDDLKIQVEGICDRLKLCDKGGSNVILKMVEGLQGGAIYSALPRSNAGCAEEDTEIETLLTTLEDRVKEFDDSGSEDLVPAIEKVVKELDLTLTRRDKKIQLNNKRAGSSTI